MTSQRPALGWSDLRGTSVGLWGLGKEGHASLRKLRALGIEKNDGFAKGQTILRSAKHKHIDSNLPGQFSRCAIGRSDSISKSCPVDVHGQMILLCNFGQLGNRVRAVESSQFG